MSYANEAALKADVQRIVLRTGDSIFEAAWPDMLARAEQCIAYGAGQPTPVPALRIRAMETQATLTFVAGEATLPSDCLQARRMVWNGYPSAVPGYATPEEFAASTYSTSNAGWPLIYTVEGLKVRILPVLAGSASFLYYAKIPSAVAGQNWLMANAPSVYLHACLLEAWSFLRNDEKRAETLASYASAVNGLQTSENVARHSVGPIYPRVRGAIIR